MLLEREDAELFFKLHRTLMVFVNGQLKVIPDTLVDPEEFASLPAELRLKIRDALNARLGLIESLSNRTRPICLKPSSTSFAPGSTS